MAHIRSRKHPNTSHLLALVAAALPVAATAQESETSLPAMTVKANAEVPYKADTVANPKFTQPLLDTAQTVQVIKKEIIQEQGAATLMEALRNTPGITMQLGENGNTSAGDTFMMRGFSTQNATFVDGVRDLGAVTRDVFNLEQVEIAKGPAGADIGRGAQSGYINLISKLPTLDSVNNASIGFGTADKKNLTADLNQRIGDNAALRLNVMARDGGVDERDYVENSSWGIAPSIAFGLNTPTRFFLYSQHVRQNNVPDGGIPSIGHKGFYATPYYDHDNNAATPTIQTAASRNLSQALNSAGKVDRENFYGGKHDHEDVSADMVTIKFEHDLGAATTIRNLTRYGKTKFDRVMTGISAPAVNRNTLNVAHAAYLDPNDPSAWVVQGSRQRIDQENEILANQTNLTTEFNTGFVKHSLSAGVELMYERQKSRSFGTGAATINGVSYVAIDNEYVNVYDPNAARKLGKPYATGAYVDGQTFTAALYAFDTLKLNDYWLVNGGFRYERFNTDTDGRTVTTASNLALYPGYAVNQLAPDNYSASDNLFSWKVGAVFKPAENGSIYAAYATSLTPPGGSNFVLSASETNQNNASMDPQETINMEIGTKWDLLDKRLNVSAAVYRSENDKQVSQDPVTGTVYQYGKTRVDGIELAAVGQLTNFWQVSAGVAKMKTKQLDQISVSSTTGEVTETDGVRWSPELTATLWTSYTLGAFTLGGGVRYVSEQKRVVSDNTPLATQNVPKIPSYWVADLMAAYQVSKNLNLRLNVYNLFDEEYISTLNNAGNRLTLGIPRSAMMTANFQF
ncbi:MAG TPA: catecholate siderophore receptor Fiu [Azonexus sp.]